MTVEAALWSYAAVDMYCNGVKCCEIQHPVYKPIEKRTVRLQLHAGLNVIYLACENLGVRDTRSIVGLQILTHRDELTVTLPDQRCVEAICHAEQVLNGVKLTAGALHFGVPADMPVSYRLMTPDPDFASHRRAAPWRTACANADIILPDGVPLVTLKIAAGPAEIHRTFERT